MKEVLINGRWPLALPDHRADRPEWGTARGWERARLDAMHDIIKPGDVVFDIGAEEGDMPALWSSWGADVVLVEPNPRVWGNIRSIWKANELADPLGCYVGFASDETTATFDAEMRTSADPVWPDCAFGEVIGDHGFCNLWERADIPRVRLDDLAARLAPPDVITIDTEGSEFAVLMGAIETLIRKRPVVFLSLHPEFMRDGYGHDPMTLLTFMGGLGYSARLLENLHEQHWILSP